MLTKRQKETLDTIKNLEQKNGYTPSLEEIQKAENLASVSTVHFHIQHLIKNGYLHKLPHKSRSLSIIKNPNITQRLENKIHTKPRTYTIEPNSINHGNSITLLDKIEPNSIHLLLSDIPYGISLDDWDVLHHNTATTLLEKNKSAVLKNGFKKRGKPIQGWNTSDRSISSQYQDWCYSWSQKLFPLLKEGASIFIFGARRTIHRSILALEDSGFILRDILVWEKPVAHNRAQAVSNIFKKRLLNQEAEDWSGWKLGNLSPKFEPIAWLFKPYQSTITDNIISNNLGAINFNTFKKNNLSPNNILKFSFKKNESGLHEAQKPLALIEHLIELTTQKNQTILDPFLGSGTTALAAKNLQRNFIGIEILKKYFTIASQRLKNKTD